MQTIDPDALTRVPKGFCSEHPPPPISCAARNWGVRCSLPAPSLALEPALAPQKSSLAFASWPRTRQKHSTTRSSLPKSPHPSLFCRVRANAFL